MLETGGTYYKLGLSGFRRRKIKMHIVAIVEGQVVTKFFGRYKQKWHYEIAPLSSIEWEINHYKDFDWPKYTAGGE